MLKRNSTVDQSRRHDKGDAELGVNRGDWTLLPFEWLAQHFAHRTDDDVNPLYVHRLEMMRTHDLEDRVNVGMSAATTRPWFETHMRTFENPAQILRQHLWIIVASGIQTEKSCLSLKRLLESGNALSSQQCR